MENFEYIEVPWEEIKDTFGAFVENRPYITKPKFEKLKDAIRDKYLICPVIVKEIDPMEEGIRDLDDEDVAVYGKKYGIIDGQHRVRVCRELEIPVPVVVNKKAKREDVVVANNTGTSWNNYNYARYWSIYYKYVKRDTVKLEHYENIIAARKKYHKCDDRTNRITEGNVFSLFSAGGSIDDGTYKFTNEHAPTTIKYCLELKGVFSHYKDSQFLRAMHKIVKNGIDFNIEILKKQLELHKDDDEDIIVMSSNDGEIYKAILDLHEIGAESKYVYIVSNPAWPGKYKVGYASDPDGRLGDYQTSDPNRAYEMPFKVLTSKYKDIEDHMHAKYGADYEWIDDNLDTLKNDINSLL